LAVAVQVANFLGDEKQRARNARLIVAAVLLAVVFTGGYAASRVVDGYRNHRDALSVFGRRVRQEASANHWRYEAIGKSDEGLPLYLTRPHFLKTDAAITQWNSGAIDALAVPMDQAPPLISQLQGATLRFESETRKELKRPNYGLLAR